MKDLHPIQKKLLELVAQNDFDPLTIRQMQEELDLSSTSLVWRHLRQLEKKGYLTRNPFNPQDYQILKNAPEQQVVTLNLYGSAHCGPNGSLLDGGVEDRIAISARLLNFPAEEGFLIRAKGDSMLPKISDGDLVIGKRAKTAANHSLVVCINNGEAMIKKFHQELPKMGDKTEGFNANDFLDYDPKFYKKRSARHRPKIILTSLNPAYAPFLASEDFRIEGEVRGVIAPIR